MVDRVKSSESITEEDRELLQISSETLRFMQASILHNQDVNRIITGKFEIKRLPFFFMKDVVAPIIQLFNLEVQA